MRFHVLAETFHPDLYSAAAAVLPVFLLTIALSHENVLPLLTYVADWLSDRDAKRLHKGKGARANPPNHRATLYAIALFGVFALFASVGEVMAVVVLLAQGSDTFVDLWILASVIIGAAVAYAVVLVFIVNVIVDFAFRGGLGPEPDDPNSGPGDNRTP